ncbi:MAG: methyltransferase [Lachnospiraceae bacterium]
MIQQLLQQILDDTNTRQALSNLRKEIKDPYKKLELVGLIPAHIPAFILLLEATDAKTRKNAALLMGDLANYDFLEALLAAYYKETQLFVRSAYLTALQAFDCSAYLDSLNAQLEKLTNTPLTAENQKHIAEEIRALSKLIIQEEGVTSHTFTGYNKNLECILLTNRNHKTLLEEELTELGATIIPFAGGVRLLTQDLASILPIRSYSELLFVVPGLTTVSTDPKEAARKIAASNLCLFLSNLHEEKTPFYFRIELKSKVDLEQKSAFNKKLASELERHTKRNLINTTSDYEVELRLIENTTGTYNVLIKLHTILDDRFSYRKEVLAASISPVDAALFVSLAKEYMIKDACILDPFCGVGTMLIERQKIVKGNTSYGIDFYASAIEKAKVNTAEAGQIIHYVNRNFFDFTHEYSFDEIFTNMPSVMGRTTQEDIDLLYENFFEKAKEVLTPYGTIIMYSHDPSLVKSLCMFHNFDIKKEFLILKKKNSWLFVISVKQ